ncbi:MAG: NACHT domain-containing protein [Phaeodactylibacter sp.]|nr:NACHT domain-containing protein [Phaeodactylibacter sp.]
MDQQYNIKEAHWYGEYQCYLSYYGQDNEKLGILCLEEPPGGERIDTFVDFIKSRSGPFHKLIIAITGEGEKSVFEQRGYTIELRYESEMLDNLIPLPRYQDYISNYFNQDTLENSSLKLSDIYVPLGGHSVVVEKGKLNPGQSIESAEKHILEWAKDQRPTSTEHLAILGDYGQGKTVLMHKIVKEMLEHPEEYMRIPILIELRGLSPRNDDELAIFGRWANRFQAKAEALWELHRAGKLFIILDGFDEMDLVGDTELLFNHFTQLWTLARVPNSQVIIAGRPNLFADDEERRMALGIQEPRIHLPYAKAIYLDKLTPVQIESALREVQPATKAGILEALDHAVENSSFRELIGRPSTLYQLSTVWDSELDKQKDRLNSAMVINSFLHKAYDRQEKKASTVLTSNERHYFMMGIAVAMMMDNEYSNQIKHKSLKRWVEQLWDHYPMKLPPYKDSMQGNKALDYLPNRLLENPEPVDTILKDVRVGGVLVQDISGRDAFKFAHKSYLELLVSAFFSSYVLQSENDRPLLMMANAITKATGFNQGKLKTSPDVEQFTAELIAAQIELVDANDNPLPVAENPTQYSKSLYKMLILNNYPIRGHFPNLTGWLSMHPDQTQFLTIGLLSFLALICFFSIQSEGWRIGITIANGMLCWWWAGKLLKYWYKKGSVEKVRFPGFLLKARLYQNTCHLMKCPVERLSDKLSLVVQNTHKKERYTNFALANLAVSISCAGVIAFISAFVIASQSTIVGIFPFLGTGIVIGLIASIGTGARLGISESIDGLMIAVSGIITFSVLTVIWIYIVMIKGTINAFSGSLPLASLSIGYGVLIIAIILGTTISITMTAKASIWRIWNSYRGTFMALIEKP